jgi:outer membrane receptor protein involved in Fe transport
VAGFVVGLGTTSIAVTAAAMPIQQAEWHVAIGRLPLNEAMTQLARQMGVEIARFSDVGSDRIVVGPLAGRFSLDQALRLLLNGTGLTYRFVNDHTVAIVRETAPAAEPQGAPQPASANPSPVRVNNGHAGQVSTEGGDIVNANSNTPKRRGFWSRILCVFAVCGATSLAPTHAGAQQASADPSAAQQNASASAPQLARLQEVTVTGSRIIKSSAASPTPVTSVNLGQLQQLNPGLASAGLATLPSLQSTPSQDLAGNGGGPQATFDVRGLGVDRNLVLFDGFRVADTTTAEAVDTNLIPQMLVQRVEVVTGGASAVYGSDAVSGVVNYVINHDFNGLEVTGQGGQDTNSTDRTWNAGIAAGTPLFDGRGHIEASVQFFHDPGVPDRDAFSWGRGDWATVGSVPGSTSTPGTAANPYLVVGNGRFAGSSFGGLINSGPLAGLQFAQNGALSPFVKGALTGSSTVQVGGDGDNYTDEWAWSGVHVGQGFGRFDYDVTDNTKAFVELAVGDATYNGSNLHGDENVFLNNVKIGYNNGYLAGVAANQPQYASTIADQLAANPLGSFTFGKITTPEDNFPAPDNITHEAQDMVIAGLDGLLGQYKWTFGYEWQRSVTGENEINTVNNGRMYAALNSVVDPTTGQVACNAALVNPSVYGGCVPLDAFGPSASSQAAFNYIETSAESWTTYDMDNVTASLEGSPFKDWAGPVDMAWSADWRELSYEVTSSALPTTPVNCTGIQFNCTSSTTSYNYGATAAFPRHSEGVSELGYETQVPLLQDLPLVHDLTLNGAARFTHYTQSGSVWTWKLGSVWQLTDTFRIRVARSYDIRAPGLQDLYEPATYGTFPLLDLHTGASGVVTTIAQGNPNLKPEKAKTWTAGFVWTPQAFDGGQLSLDFYHIYIGDALVTITPTQPADEAACDASGGTSAICALFVRPYPFSDASPDNFPTLALSEELNTAFLETYGADGEFDYRHEIAGHHFTAQLLMNYQPHLIYNQGPGVTLDVGDSADGVGGLSAVPSVKGTLALDYEVIHNVSLMVQERYRNGLKPNGSALLYYLDDGLRPQYYTDMTVGYNRSVGTGDLDVFLNIRDLFNKQPQPWASAGGNGQIGALGGYSAIDDNLGRYFTLGVRYRLQ